jgi:S-formylglutathione hydrolase FrmB
VSDITPDVRSPIGLIHVYRDKHGTGLRNRTVVNFVVQDHFVAVTVLDVSLISGFLPIAIIAVAMIAMIAAVDWRAANRRRHVATGVAVAIALTDVLALVQHEADLVPYAFPLRYYAWVAGIFLALGLCVFTRPIGWWRRTVGLIAVPLMVAAALTLINVDFQAYPTVQSLAGSGAVHQTSLEELLAQRSHPTGEALPGGNGQQVVAQSAAKSSAGVYGEAIDVSIPATKSHFAARDAWVWVPPAYVSARMTALPVLMLLGGSPGRTNDWLRAGYADRSAQAFADAHDGLAPIMVMPDANGSMMGDTECVDGKAGNSETYLTEDVPAFLHSKFGTLTGRNFAVAGFSEGGTCAVMLALRHPAMFTGFADFSGLTSPTLTERVNPTETANGLFGGSMKNYLAHDPLELLRKRDLHGGAYFAVGANDAVHVKAQRTLVALAQGSGLTVCATETSGAGHSYGFWAQALATALPTLSAELNITPKPKAACSLNSSANAAAEAPATHTP